MITVHAQLFDGAGDETDARDVSGHTLAAAMIEAQAWGRGALKQAEDPDAYVKYTAIESKR